MDTVTALETLRALADGVDPFTGESYPMQSPYQHPQVIRALFQAIYALQVLRQREKRTAAMPEKAGVSWTAEEDERLVAKAQAGVPLDQLAREHQRTRHSIHSRLSKLGKVSPEASAL